MERKGAAYHITQTRPGGVDETGGGSRLINHDGHEYALSTAQGPHGHTAEVSYSNPYRLETSTYVAGPFRTQQRAEVAASALQGRVQNDSADPYRRTTHRFTEDEWR